MTSRPMRKEGTVDDDPRKRAEHEGDGRPEELDQPASRLAGRTGPQGAGASRPAAGLRRFMDLCLRCADPDLPSGRDRLRLRPVAWRRGMVACLIAGPLRQLHPVSYTHLRAHETRHDLVCRLLLEK